MSSASIVAASSESPEMPTDSDITLMDSAERVVGFFTPRDFMMPELLIIQFEKEFFENIGSNSRNLGLFDGFLEDFHVFVVLANSRAPAEISRHKSA